MTLHDRHDVVEVVGDPAGKGAEGLHLDRLDLLSFEQVLFGHVDVDTDDADRSCRRRRPR